MRSGGSLGDALVSYGGGTHKPFLILILAPSPSGVPGEGPDCHFRLEMVWFRPDLGRLTYFYFVILALSTARTQEDEPLRRGDCGAAARLATSSSLTVGEHEHVFLF